MLIEDESKGAWGSAGDASAGCYALIRGLFNSRDGVRHCPIYKETAFQGGLVLIARGFNRRDKEV